MWFLFHRGRAGRLYKRGDQLVKVAKRLETDTVLAEGATRAALSLLEAELTHIQHARGIFANIVKAASVPG